ncbi:MAG: NADH-quinone oxidoreductase subunit NuoF [Candidatus Cloacimonadaceae bacterium]|jgi:NADH-quinone oxidoreductase subunit F|nr:NADH-quinone oxidoreductase subunit NuoF [Candidatus Cloacimonadota bacterium]MDY0127913.1 NADH-quinone oxidoreductase subunit NuoF [Candidatus Cloacimonadaceae bacterium]MCB5255487.1 NADH-quinone oxidoreductase subunit NuoF [Candidatus Cloacimonadota bacterium]MCK9178409.1 NADH-quinone oxidoreductase subunit NuoF [Candidatus Cloacimonadota bacterium]MCK9243023.1 NADH-quinone oxidoreductase subunit NuoF [Candidatus Cloacimonadota bacterium]
MSKITVKVGLASCGVAAGAMEVYEHLKQQLQAGADYQLMRTACIGMCFEEPIVELSGGKLGRISLGKVEPQSILEHIEAYRQGKVPQANVILTDIDKGSRDSLLQEQTRIVLRNCGVIDPCSIADYEAHGGYAALKKALSLRPQEVIEQIKASGLRGRGGAGFPTGLKWSFTAQARGAKKYIICNADEGDPGAFMDRSTLEGDPHNVIEGMIIGAYAMGADEGYIYCRAEYPMAVKHLKLAIADAQRNGYLGRKILGTNFFFTLHVKEGAGAFVCGEETALMQSIEGKRGMPVIRPPFPAESGLWGCPTNINNVETWANITWIINHGAEEFKKIGTEKSAGTKVFALAGKIAGSGLIEVPMGITLRDIIYKVGGGMKSDKPFKAVQMGGPSGGCIPAELLDTTVDYDSINATGAIMGSGGMVVMDSSTCMVDVARFFLNFTQSESCGKCTFCRIGTRRMLEILTRITEGEGTIEDIEKLQDLAANITKGSLCGLGQTAPNPVLTTLRYFEDEYLAHIQDKRCPAGVCSALIRYEILPDKCIGCTACAKVCPPQCITGKVKEIHIINQDLCIHCGACYSACKFNAITKG